MKTRALMLFVQFFCFFILCSSQSLSPGPRCVPGQFQCRDGKCINDYQKCNRIFDCQEGEDELNCPAGCNADQFACGSGECIPLPAKCNHKYDCEDFSDEKNCPCHQDDFRCGNGNCIPGQQRCNGIRNCQDGSDETNCANVAPCRPNEWRCSDGTCIRKSLRCDSKMDCPDNSDEHNCDSCKIDQFRCNNGTCIKLSQRCDRKKDCSDGEDEDPPCVWCSNDEFQCSNGRCISINRRCDGITDCQDTSDETNCNALRPCASGEIKCTDGSCVIGKTCDRIFDCLDGSDEVGCGFCSPSQFKCSSGECIEDFMRCDSRSDCQDGSDEKECVYKCPGNKFRCADGLCLNPNRRCDGYADCNDGSDEANCTTMPRCTDNEFTCESGECIPKNRHCDSRPDCQDESDEIDCRPKRCSPSEFTCGDGSCIPNEQQCNGVAECRDGSDEEECPCTPGQFICTDGQCIDGSKRCDRYKDCSDGSDEFNCATEAPAPSTEYPITPPPRCPTGYFECQSGGKCIYESQVCDGPTDCPDASDELNCGLKLRTYPNYTDERINREVVFQCRDEGYLHAQVHWIRANGLPLPPGSRDIRGRLEIPDIQLEHSGEYICEAVNFPSNKNSQARVQLNVHGWTRPTTPRPKACSPHEATCSNGDCISKSKVCDGRRDCTDGSDESRCRINGCEPNEFICSNKKCVMKNWQCDGQDDCEDGSDEKNCATSAPGSLCQPYHFTCRSNNECILKSFRCDAENDCADGSDEFGCAPPVIARTPPPMVTLAAGQLFEIKCTAVGVPVPEISWRLNWGHIPPKCRTTSIDGVGILTCPDIQREDQGAYSCEAINSKGRTFANPDTILTVSSENPCRPGYFNSEAKTEAECIKCFCFGQGVSCRSADLFIYHYQPPFDSLKVVGVKIDPYTGSAEITDEAVYRNAVPQLAGVGHNGVNSYLSSDAELTQPNIVPYFAMPENYHGNQLKSYGGYLRYNVNQDNRGYAVRGPDVILSGNGYLLVHDDRRSLETDREQNKAVRFFVGEWVKRSDDGPEIIATREEIMMALANIDNILIKLQYNEGQLNTTLTDIVMESAAAIDNTLGAASYVEECSCPVGYTGLSCERCDEGFERHSSGPWLGQCYKASQTCEPGTYGDPSRGIECKTCPCPMTNPSNQFGRTCSLAPDGDVICDCPPEYAGRRCEQCASGFVGNPMVSGDYCRPRQEEVCSAAGSKEVTPISGRCQCKDNVDGANCDQCKANTFFLSEQNQFGCIACFCMGVSRQCSSSSWYRDQISSAFTTSTHDFAILDIENKVPLTDVQLDSTPRQLLYSSFNSPNVFYWTLPSRYLGNKLTSYGGVLRYTLKYVPRPGGQSSRNSAADVQLISANRINLLYYAKEQPLLTNSAQTFTVPLQEQYWQRGDGQVADREHMLMTLADLKAIYIKATYTTNTMQAALVSVSLDTASSRNTGSLERASAVEHCYCPEGYKGLSCEDCAFGYTRGLQGIYLGACEKCNCNGHSNECDPETGACLNCRNHTTGRQCDQCMPGYEGNPQKGITCQYRRGGSCQCDPMGSISSECQNGICRCKPNVEGDMCNRCRHGTFGLNARNDEGCQSCFCSGVSSECSESNYYIEQIPTIILDEKNHGFTLTDQKLQTRIENNFYLDYGINEISYQFGPSDSRLYWSLPRLLTGNQIKSYGGKLEFNQKYSESTPGRHIPDQDVIIIGEKLTVYWMNPTPPIVDVQNRISVPISVSNGWQRLDQSTGPRPASREDILVALSNIKEILIRAQFSDTTESSSISDVTLDTALEAYTAQGKATNVELCNCPIGYEGSSCESCVLGYYRDINDLSTGPLGSCRKCPCSQNAHGCSLGPDNSVVCHCIPGFSGSRCEYIAGNNTDTSGGTTTSPPVMINVTIVSPNIKIFEIGSTLTLKCSANSYRTNSPAEVYWSKDGEPLPETAIPDGRGLLVITNLKVTDSGRYICEANDGYSIVTRDINVIVGTSPPQRPRVVVNPPFVDVKEGQRMEVQCAGSGNPAPNYILQRVDNQPLNRLHSFEDGIFRIERVILSDAGQYNCIAQNSHGSDTAMFEVSVRASESVRVTIEPSSIRASAGETFTLRCLSPNGAQDIRWLKANGPLPYDNRQDNGILTVYNARVEDSGEYVCTILNHNGALGRGSASVEVIETQGEAPSARITSGNYTTISRGSTVQLVCETSGSPAPHVKWTKLHKERSEHFRQVGHILYITDADERDEDIYICVADNSFGFAEARVDVVINRGRAPLARIYPDSNQRVIAGQSFDLECSAENGFSSRITWTRANGQPISRNVEILYDTGNIRFNQITKNEEGQYICTVENEAGRGTAVANIVVLSPPEIRITPNQDIITKREGDSLTLTCEALGSSPSDVYWEKYGVTPLKSSQPPSRNYALHQIRRLSRNDEGVYICRVRNDAGTTQKQVKLIVDTLPERGDIIGEDATSENSGYKGLDRPRNEINRYIAPVGTRAEMRCSVSTDDRRSNEQIDTKWVRPDNSPLPENAYVRGGSLYIDDVQESAKGHYNCLGTRRSTGQLLFTLSAYLDVISPPNITLEPKRQVVHPGDNAYIQCSASGQQPIDITWSPMGRGLPSSVSIKGGLMQFINIKPSDAGRYRCTAKNSAGEADAVADVFVQETRYTPSITAVNKSPSAPVGSSVTLQCSIGNETYPDVRWYREGLPLPNHRITPEKNLEIYNVEFSDEGRYYCEIPGYSKDFVDLKVTGPTPDGNLILPTLFISPQEKEYLVGEDVDINCQSNQPGAITTWSKPSGWLDDNVQNVGGTLRIRNLRRENAGVYRCEASGALGPYHKDYNLKITEDHSRLQAAVETKIAPKGSGVILECRTNLQEPINYKWTKSGGELPRYIDPYSRTIQLNDLGSSDAGSYLCTAQDFQRKVEIPVILVITGIVPYFSQAPVSFIALRSLMDSYTQFSFEISIKPQNEDGLILYNGNKQDQRDGDFISLALSDGVPEFKYNLGDSPTIVKSRPISMGQWHTIKVIRNKKRVTMYVDGEGPYIGNAEGRLIGLELTENLYLGGVPRFDGISPEVKMETGFVGCISHFKIAHAEQDILRDALEKEGITNCETCSENRCQNRGVCQESLTSEGYICICHSGFSGATCSKLKGEACSAYSCGKGRCTDNDEGFECMCPLGKTGSRCERDIKIEQPAFQNNSFIAYNVPKQRKLKFSLKFRANTLSDGILLYCGESEEGYGDFASLALKDQFVEFRFNGYSGTTIIRSSARVNKGEWVAVTATRNFNEGRLMINGGAPVIEKSLERSLGKVLNLLTHLYVGGVDKQKIKVNEEVGVSSGFDGCISDVYTGGPEIDMVQSAVDSSNVQDCSNMQNYDINNNINYERTAATPYNHHQTGCSSNPCRNDGVCYPLSPITYECSCVNGYSGRDCQVAPNQCDYLKPCQNNGTCMGNTTYYSCDCPLGFSGTNCEQRAELRNDAHFDGNGYLEFDRKMLPHDNDNAEELIALELSTNSSEGLIFWHGQSPNQDAQGQDYIALSVVNGYLEFSFDLGSGPAIIHNGQIRINDGKRHIVILKRRGRSGYIEIDRQNTQKDEAVGQSNTLTCRGNIYLGGTPDIPSMTANRFRHGFVGCIHGFELEETKQIDLGRAALSGSNVRACSSYDGDYSNEDEEDNELIN